MKCARSNFILTRIEYTNHQVLHLLLWMLKYFLPRGKCTYYPCSPLFLRKSVWCVMSLNFDLENFANNLLGFGALEVYHPSCSPFGITLDIRYTLSLTFKNWHEIRSNAMRVSPNKFIFGSVLFMITLFKFFDLLLLTRLKILSVCALPNKEGDKIWYIEKTTQP